MALVDLSDQYAVDLSLNMQYASRVLHLAVTGELSRCRLVPSQFEVLRRLAAEPHGTLRTGELAGPATTTVSGMSRLVDRLITERLVTRTNSADDRRVQFVTITDTGRQRLAEARSVIHAAVTQVLDEAGLRSVTRLLAELGRADG